MTIEYVTGNVLGAPADSIIVHGCNARGVMGSGVALAVKQTYPEAFEVYLRSHYEHGLKLGEYTHYKTDGGTTIVNAITQERYGARKERYVSYEALAVVFEKIVEDVNFIHPSSKFDEATMDYSTSGELIIAFPKIGAGLGGGSWDVISAIIDEAIPNTFRKLCYEL